MGLKLRRNSELPKVIIVQCGLGSALSHVTCNFVGVSSIQLSNNTWHNTLIMSFVYGLVGIIIDRT